MDSLPTFVFIKVIAKGYPKWMEKEEKEEMERERERRREIVR